ncbi:MAG: translation initiation factor IF-2 [Puniceicoccales bacterium]|jgi:translation initiation factor IF-2|nr:translation initiation factor IF-2 [Puniceicoccales bacterium]
MSVRVYQLSKQLGKDNKQIIALLQARGLSIQSASSTVPNIYADALLEEFKDTVPQSENADIEAPKTSKDLDVTDSEPPSASNIDKNPLKQDEVKLNTPIPTEANQPIKTPFSYSQTSIASATSSNQTAFLPRTKPAPRPPAILLEKRQVVAADAIAAFSNSVRKLSTEKGPTSGTKVVSQPTDVISNKSSSTPSNAAISSSIPTIPRFSPHFSPRPSIKEFKIPAPLPHLAPVPPMAKNEPEVTRALKVLRAKTPIIVHEFASAIGIKPFQLISELMRLGIFASMNQSIVEEIAAKVAKKYGFQLEVRRRGEESDPKRRKERTSPIATDTSEQRELRPPIVCVLGHIDHGKTTLLDAIRQTDVASGEAGGITQHIAAYQVEVQGKKITFLDTPGHAAFAKMRQRGANVTDIAILVVAADDGFMPQTDEALKFAQKAGVPVVVAINKIDVKGANIDRVKQQMQQRSITPEEWGGETLCIGISATQKTHLQELLELVLIQAEMLELKANPKANTEAVIIESQVDTGHGVAATAIIQEGTLAIGTVLVCGSQYCRVRALFDDHGKSIKTAPPSTPIRIIGWSGAPEVGSLAHAVKEEKQARAEAEENASLEKKSREQSTSSIFGKNAQETFAALGTPSHEKVLKLLVKTDVQGSIEAVRLCLESILSNKVHWEIIAQSVGNICKNDIELAHSSDATILGFNTSYDSGAAALVKNLQVKVLRHSIIYELADQVRDAMTDLLEPELHENYLGSAQVRQIFHLSKGLVAGCMVIDGKIIREKFLRVKRGKQLLFKGRIASLKHLKEDLPEVRAGFECGIQSQGFTAFEINDDIECYEVVEQRPSL